MPGAMITMAPGSKLHDWLKALKPSDFVVWKLISFEFGLVSSAIASTDDDGKWIGRSFEKRLAGIILQECGRMLRP
tara:strand:- start:33 stop:260 length:228 start_codon:yes stop_codon:yes gene_type:complete